MISNNSYCWGTVRIAVGITMMVLLLGNGAIAKSINDNTTGGDCISFGTWDAANKTCIMTTNINEGIQIDSNGITLDGNGHTITGNNTGYGVFLSGYTSGRTDVTIRNVKVKQFTDGILLSYSNKNNLTDNIVSNNGYGIALTSSRNNNLTNNTVSNNSEGIIFDVGPSDYSYYNNLTGNIIENNINRGISVKGFYNNLFSNKVSNNSKGFELYFASYNNLTNNTISYNSLGIDSSWGADYNHFTGNTISNNSGYAILLRHGDNNYVTDNSVSNNSVGIVIDENNATIFNNYFNNTENSRFYYSKYIWNITKQLGTNIVGGPYLGGNFWAYPNDTGFSQTCTDDNADGICDSAYVLDSNNTDYLPLSMNIILDTTPPPSVTNLTNLSYSQNYINWTWTDPADEDFYKVMIYLNGIFQNNITKGIQYYNITGLTPDTIYNLSTRTVDIAGNINTTWINQSVKTAKPLPSGVSYWGYVTLDGLPQSNASIIVIDSSGNTVANATSNQDALYRVFVPWVDSYTQSESLTFKVNGTTATTKTIGERGSSLRLDLSASAGGMEEATLVINSSGMNFFVKKTTAIMDGGNSAGGGGGGSSGENYSNIEVSEKYDLQISKDVLTSYRFNHSKNPIMFVNITGTTNFGIITASIEVLKNTSTLVKTAPDALVYKNANIWVGTAGVATPKNIKQALIKFRVDNTWMSANGVSGSDIVLAKWDGSAWIKLETSESAKDETFAYYEAKTQTFSSFAIIGLKGEKSAPVSTVVVIETPAKLISTPTIVPTKGLPGFEIVITIAVIYMVGRKKK